MFTVNPPIIKPKVNYSKLLAQHEQKEQSLNTSNTPSVPDDEGVPNAPPGFAFYRVQNGDTLVSLSIKFNVSQGRLKRYNREICFGHRLAHIVNKLILVPMVNDIKITSDIREQLEQLLINDESKQNLNEKEYKEPDENGKYQLRKALIYHAKGCDEHRANYYLGEANWNVRKALELFRNDDKWDKKNRVVTACPDITHNEAENLLNMYNGDVSAAITHWDKQKRKEAKENEKIVKTLNRRNKGIKTNTTNTNQIELQTELNSEGQNDDVDAQGFDNFKKCC